MDKYGTGLFAGIPAAVVDISEMLESSVCKTSVKGTLALALALADITVCDQHIGFIQMDLAWHHVFNNYAIWYVSSGGQERPTTHFISKWFQNYYMYPSICCFFCSRSHHILVEQNAWEMLYSDTKREYRHHLNRHAAEDLARSCFRHRMPSNCQHHKYMAECLAR